MTDGRGHRGTPVVIGHSMGGFVTIATAAIHPDRLAGVIICDSPVTTPDPEVRSYQTKESFGRPRTYATVEDALARFRTVPEQADVPRLRHRPRRPPVDEARSTAGGSGSSTATSSSRSAAACAASPSRTCPRCAAGSRCCARQRGLVTKDIGAEMYEALGRVAPVIELPEAGHHPMLDQPLILLTALRTLLADWDHSEPAPAGSRGERGGPTTPTPFSGQSPYRPAGLAAQRSARRQAGRHGDAVDDGQHDARRVVGVVGDLDGLAVGDRLERPHRRGCRRARRR